YFKGILRERTPDGYSPITSQPITVQLRDDNWNTLYQDEYWTNEWGSFSGEFKLPKNASLGTYTLVAQRQNDYEYGYFSVSSYEKPEFIVELKTDSTVYAVGDTISVQVNAEYFYGS